MMACILVIDTNPRIRTGLRHILAYAGYDVMDACDAGEGIHSAQLRPIDLVILDLRRPASVEVMRRLQTVRPAVKMLAMADGGGPEDVPRAHAATLAGAHKTLQKPVGAQDLLAAVQALLASS